jgi:hypothetical protein
MPIVGDPPPLHSGRYFLSPVLFLVVCVAVLVDRAVVDQTQPAVVVGGIAVVWLVTVGAANYVIAPLANGPSWEAGLEVARVECATDQQDDVEVAIAPRESWKVRLPCSDL